VSARSKARKRALDVLYQADLRAVSPLVALSEEESRRAATHDPELNPLVRALVEGVVEHQDHIDELLATYSMGWTIERMPAVDLAALRIGTFEIMWADDVPDGVAIAEAVELVANLSTDESPSFVNGLLARIVEIKPTVV